MTLNYQPSKELSLILTAATLGCPHKTQPIEIHWRDIDWQKTLKLANFHGLSCWLAEYVKDVPQVPDEIKKRLTLKQRKQSLFHVFTEQKKTELVSLLTKANIRFAILKGVAIAKPLYGERWHYRAIVDLDILIDPVQLKQAFELIKSQGYVDIGKKPLNSADFKKIATDHQKLVIIEHTIELPKQQLQLDIHWKLRRNALLPLEYGDLFNSIKSDNAVPRLKEPLEFIHICVCGTNDGWQKLKTVVDILHYAQLIEDWTEIDELADRLGLAHIINASLAVCDYFFGTRYGPTQLNRKEHTILVFVINSFAKYDEVPCVHSYIDNSNVYQFTKTTLSWWMAIHSDLVSPLTAFRELATPNNEDIAKGTLSGEGGIGRQLFKRAVRIVRKYYMAKRD